MKYKVVTEIPVFDNTLWIVRKNATEYIFKTTKPTNTEITDAKYQNYCNYNDITKYKYHGLSTNNATVNSVSPDRYLFAYSDNVQYILTNDGLLLVKFNSQYLLFDLLNINTEKLEELPPTENFINENSLEYLLDWTTNKEGFYSRFWNFIHVYKDNSEIVYHRTRQFAADGYTHYISFLDELDDIETNLSSIFFKVLTVNYAEAESTFRKYPKDFYIIESDAELNISVYYIEISKNSETLNNNISIDNGNIVPVTNAENNKKIYLIKLLKNNNNFDEIDRVGFKFTSSGNPTYIKII